ncbi:MAG: hypothetical protein PHS19_03110, partial [Eubacteriales bacterium]|nr:hypothetical protein [Eubacteriales bacterium]
HFVNWTKGDDEVSTAAKVVPEKVDGLNVAATYTANFEANPVPVPPVPGPGPGPGPGPAAAGGGGAPALVAIEPAPAPAAAVEIEDQEVPKSLLDLGSWALLNLLLTILACIMSVALIITFFTRKKDEDEEEEKLKKKGVWRAISAVWGILMIIVFLVTEDMSLPMVFVDKWTIMMIIMTAIQGGVMIMSRKKYVEEDSEMA